MSDFTHFDEDGASRMVDVGGKADTERVARASAEVWMAPTTLEQIRDQKFAKGDVLEVARLAAIMATKQTSNLIPLCHAIPITAANVDFKILGESGIRIFATVKSQGKTGVEMEALTAVATAGLTIYDMCKAVDRSMTITNIQLDEKQGGKSGHFVRSS